MDHPQAVRAFCRVTVWAWKSNSNKDNPIVVSKTLIPKPFPNSVKPIAHQLFSLGVSQQRAVTAQDSCTKDHTTLLVESYYEHQSLKALVDKLNKKASCPLEILQDDGDWSKDHFWTVIRFLQHSSRSKEILQVFDAWKNKEISRNNELNFEKIIVVLGEEGLVEDAVSAFLEMKSLDLTPSLQIYNSLIHGYARNGKFDDAFLCLNQMKEINLSPESDTYDGLIQAYGKYKMYDEMGMCLKRMELDGCLPDQFTYNLLIKEFAHGGLLTRMERVYQSMRTRKMNSESSTSIAMLEAYANFGIVEKMEKALRRVRHSKAPLKDDLVRQIACVYIKNYMFSRLDDLGDYLASRTGRTNIVWCLRLLSHACLLSRKGMDSVVKEMEGANVSWNVTIANTILLAYLKMKDFTRLRTLLSKLPNHNLKPDIVTVGILFDASSIGFEGTEALQTWKRMGILYKCAKMNTDPLVLAAFGKGQFVRNCEEVYSSLEPEAREERSWTYYNLIHLVTKHNEGTLSLKEI
uniref:Uncharacterized protein MANES_05G198900 n=1 Tax=Rhizophora mucronata TaxID=61149 RepID=A0A2P2JC01_RHIMU